MGDAMRPHEPECQHYVEEAVNRTGACIFCGIARAAYKRGREDAAEAILDLHCDLHDDGPDEECLVRASSAVAAARWDGEQA